MPELPEVESVRRVLDAQLVGRTVARVRVFTREMVSLPGDPEAGFMRARSDASPVRIRAGLLLAGSTIVATERRGKQLALVGSDGPAVCIQLGMTGSVRLGGREAPLHTHLEWALDDGRRVWFVDPRRFGLVAGHASLSDLIERRWSRLGPDALSLTASQLRHACAGRSSSIKAVLLDQMRLAGVGNIYADEALFRARLDPRSPAGALPGPAIARLAGAIRTTLRQAIEAGGSTIRDYRAPGGGSGAFQDRHRVYGRAGLPCTACGGVLEGLRLAQRSTVFCPVCQRSGR